MSLGGIFFVSYLVIVYDSLFDVFARMISFLKQRIFLHNSISYCTVKFVGNDRLGTRLKYKVNVKQDGDHIH